MIRTTTLLKRWGTAALVLGISVLGYRANAASHREAPLIAQDPQADNTDLYVFRSPDDTNTVTIIANYIPYQLPEAGPNYYSFGNNVQYDIHVKNNTATTTDDISYRFAFTTLDEDGNTIFNMRLGKRNQRQVYTMSRSVNGGAFTPVVTFRAVPPANAGARSINGAQGLALPYDYDSVLRAAVATATSGEKVFVGPADDPYFADMAGLFDQAGMRPSGNTVNAPFDGMARFNVFSIAIKVPITTLQKAGKNTTSALNILDEDYVIGVWASASRRQYRTLNGDGTITVPPTNGMANFFNNNVQISRVGNPLLNDLYIPFNRKDLFNNLSATAAGNSVFLPFLRNPEFAKYMDARQQANNFPAFNALRVPERSRPDLVAGGYDFGTMKKGLWPLKGSNLLSGTAFDPNRYGSILLPDSMSPRAADVVPFFLTGIPNAAPYQLAVGKPNLPNTTTMNPFGLGKPFVNNFFPNAADMIRLNMAVPVTPRNHPDFSSQGLMRAVVMGMTNPLYNNNTNMQWIPNMDGFPNGRRLEDDVVTIQMQMLGGLLLHATGFFFDDWVGGGTTVTPCFQRNISFNAGPSRNDTTFKAAFPYVASPWRGTDYIPQARF
jgi:hypothetical protein